LREESAKPSASRTVGTPTIWLGMVEIARETPDHLELLEVLLAEISPVWRRHHSSLVTTVATPAK